MWKKIRIALLLFIFVLIAADTYMTKFRSVSWDETLWVGIYPINVDNDPTVERYLDRLTERQFDSIETFFQKEVGDYGIDINEPFKFVLAHRVNELPPPPPAKGSNILQVAWWSLKLRYWAFNVDQADFSPHIKMFVIYHNYDREDKLAHSLGLDKGMIGVVHAYAHRELEGKNNLVIAHEVLHTLGATDKYDLQTGEPIHPQGFANPEQTPLYPQRFTELMGGRTPVSPGRSIMPRSLRSVEIGTYTAREINWLQ